MGSVATSATAPPSADSSSAADALSAMAANPPVAQTPAPIGTLSWIAQVLAALGGAVAAGSVAWILIGPMPLRADD